MFCNSNTVLVYKKVKIIKLLDLLIYANNSAEKQGINSSKDLIKTHVTHFAVGLHKNRV